MFTLTIESLPPKFQPFILGSPSCTAPIKDEIEAVFWGSVTFLKATHILDAGSYVLKLGRADGVPTTPDTHLYRVRKAEKIRDYIRRNKLEADIAVPDKYLYWHIGEKQFYVVARKLSLSREVAKAASEEVSALLKADANIGGQARALASGAPQRSLTPAQAKALAELSVLGYTDLTYNNLYFTHDGKVAILDTEPQKRFLKKQISASFVAAFLGDKRALLCQQACAGIAKLKLSIDNPLALQAVEKVERNHVLWVLAQLVAKIALVSLAIYFIPTIAALVPIAPVVTVLAFCLKTVAIAKAIELVRNSISVYALWRLSRSGMQGLNQIRNMEKLGKI